MSNILLFEQHLETWSDKACLRKSSIYLSKCSVLVTLKLGEYQLLWKTGTMGQKLQNDLV